MIPKTKRLFISYRSSNHREVDHIAEQLRSVKHDDGTAKYKTWQDKHDLEAGKSWWDGIVDAIIECDMFIFHLSPDYLESAVCIAELNYAVARNRPIIPVVLASAYYINPHTKKPDIEFWADMPEWLGKYQFLFYNDDDFYNRFDRAVATYEQNWPQDIEVRRPLNPDTNAIHGNNYAVYATAAERALQVAFDEAKPLFRELLQRNDADFAEQCHQWLTIIERYQDLLDAKKHPSTYSVFKRKLEAYLALFPLDFIDDLYPEADEHLIIFDPINLIQQDQQPQKAQQSGLSAGNLFQSASQRIRAFSKPTTLSLMPVPFDWIKIPAGKLQTSIYRGNVRRRKRATNAVPKPTFRNIERFSISKYPITNAQFRQFVEADGYYNQNWWTKSGWQFRVEGWHYDTDDGWKRGSPLTKPNFWENEKLNGDDYPVVGVSWYEAVAFCMWLSETTKDNIMLPNQEQWQYAAQGKDGRKYPWGNDWDCDRCNNSDTPCVSNSTTPVTSYEGKGNSYFGVVDMAGNVEEWCLTDKYGYNDINDEDDETIRALFGGSWQTLRYPCNLGPLLWEPPDMRTETYGFRIVRTK